jgi:hypothetical protein
MFSKYALFIFIALHILSCEAVDSAVLPRGMPQRLDKMNRNTKFSHRRNLKAMSSTIVARPEVPTIVAASEPEITLNAFDLCLCGAFATAFGDFVMHPVDTIKVSQQVGISIVPVIFISSYLLYFHYLFRNCSKILPIFD